MNKNKNQFGRKTWDVEEYTKIAKNRNKFKHKIVNNSNNNNNNNNIINQINLTNTQFGEEESWFKCDICRRKFKDTLKLSEHFSSKMHIDKLKEYDDHNNNDNNNSNSNSNSSGISISNKSMPITLENVKKYIEKLEEMKRS